MGHCGSVSRHPEADEILFLQNGTARAHLGDMVREVHAGASVFISAGTWISADNLGSAAINLVAIFSAPGFEGFMRETSAGVRRKKCSAVSGRRGCGREKACPRDDLSVTGRRSSGLPAL